LDAPQDGPQLRPHVRGSRRHHHLQVRHGGFIGRFCIELCWMPQIAVKSSGGAVLCRSGSRRHHHLQVRTACGSLILVMVCTLAHRLCGLCLPVTVRVLEVGVGVLELGLQQSTLKSPGATVVRWLSLYCAECVEKLALAPHYGAFTRRLTCHNACCYTSSCACYVLCAESCAVQSASFENIGRIQ
jgi:hypothetical protein